MPSGGIRYGIIISIWVLLTVIFITVEGLKSKPLSFNSITADGVFKLLTPLFLIALFLERAQEVFISAWRDLDAEKFKEKLKQLKREKERAVEGGDSTKIDSVIQKIQSSRDSQSLYKAKTAQLAFFSGTSIGLLISLVGIRVLNPIVNHAHAGLESGQLWAFNFLDIFLTAGLIGGGAEGIHRVLATFTNFLDKSREKMNK